MSKSTPIRSPLDVLLSYQRKFVADTARFKIGMFSRQTGKSFSGAGELTADALQKPDTLWVVLSAGERQAVDFMRKVHQWAEAFEFAIASYVEDRDQKEALLKRAEVEFGNRSRVIALPANPATARGYSGNLFLDEFAFHEKPDDIWRAIYPSVSNPLKGELKVRIVSTPNGKANKFADLWLKENNWSKHKVTIHDAIAGGLPLDAEELRLALDDEEGWRQEYLCEFVDGSAVLLPYDLIRACESDVVPEASSIDGRFLGIDIGRKHDLTVGYELGQLGDVFHTTEILEMQNTPFSEQMERLDPMVRRADRVWIDATGIGAMLAETLRDRHGSKVLECKFTSAFKTDIFTGLRRAFEDRRLRIPLSKVLREDLHAMQKVTGNNGTIRYAAPTSADGHSDRATGLALAIGAALQPQEFGWYL